MFADIDWCEAVFILTGHKETDRVWGEDPMTGVTMILSGPMREEDVAPAYNLYELLSLTTKFEPRLFYQKGGVISKEAIWGVTIQEDTDGMFLEFDDNPANAVAKLIMKLQKEGFWNESRI